jgi:hypothetical protein
MKEYNEPKKIVFKKGYFEWLVKRW